METGMNAIYQDIFKDYPDVMDVQQVGKLLNICDKTVYKLIRTGVLPSMRVGRKHRITKVNIFKYMQYFDGTAIETHPASDS